MSPDIFALIPFIIPPTALSRAIAEEVVKLASLQKYKVKALRGFSATRLPVFLEAQAHPEVAILIYFGHASQSKLCGESILCDTITVEDASWLKDKVVCSLPACESAHTLGPELVRRGVRAYFGSEDTMYAHFTEIEHNYFSCDRHTPIIIKKDNSIIKTTFDKIIENPLFLNNKKPLEVASFDKVLNTPCFAEISKIVQHKPSKKAIKITDEQGGTLIVSPGHSVMIMSKTGKLKAVKASELQVGDYLVGL
ncbi:MAG: hypothetical protein K6T73_03335 [Candidatus Bathyarchaeota archaeon]|nr:hypothetical protein [Candidatus Bathyarchaeota archaeon]